MTRESNLDECGGVRLHWFLQEWAVCTKTLKSETCNALFGKEYTAGEMWMDDEGTDHKVQLQYAKEFLIYFVGIGWLCSIIIIAPL